MRWVLLADERRAVELPDELVAAGRFDLPPLSPRPLLAVMNGDVPPAPLPPRMYVKAWPERHEYVVTDDVPATRRGTIISEMPGAPYTAALVFERVGA